MTIRRGKFKLYEFSEKDEVFDIYCKFLRLQSNIKMIGRYEYLMSINIDDIKQYLCEINKSPNDSFWAVNYENEFIGTVKLGHINWRIGTGDLGIMIGNNRFRGKGFSQIICSMVIEYGFNVLGLRRISAGCFEDNIPMCRCFEKIGFSKIGVERQNVMLDGRYSNHVLYDMLKNEWENEENEYE